MTSRRSRTIAPPRAFGDPRAEPSGDLFGQRRHRVAEYQFLDGWQAGRVAAAAKAEA